MQGHVREREKKGSMRMLVENESCNKRWKHARIGCEYEFPRVHDT